MLDRGLRGSQFRLRAGRAARRAAPRPAGTRPRSERARSGRSPRPRARGTSPGATITPASRRPVGERLGRLALGYGDPEVHRGRAARVAQPDAREQVEERRTLARVRAPCALDVGLVAPGDDRRPLDELLRRRAHVRAVALEGVNEDGVAGDEARAEACHRGALRERVERHHGRPVVQLERGRGWRLEPELGVSLVGGEDEVEPPSELCRLRQEGERRDGAGGVVRRVQPEHGGALPGLVGNRVEVGEEAVALQQRQLDDARSDVLGATDGNGIAGLGRDHGVTPAGEIEHHLREREDRLLRAERRDHLGVRIQGRAEAPPDPAGDRLPQLGKACSGRVAHALPHAVLQRLEDHRVGGLARIAHAEVDHLESGRPSSRGCLVEPDERVRRLRLEDGGERPSSA